MRLGPWLVTRGLVFGNLLVILLTSIFSANASPVAAAQSLESPVRPASQVAPDQQAAQPAQSMPCAVSPAFPEDVLQWCAIITRHALENALEPDLVAAVILQESGGDPQALSHSGAVGLMQVMPRDGVAASFMCVNGPCFADRPESEELRQPEFNVAYGASMLKRLLEREGSLRAALKAYGPMDRGYSYADRVLALAQRYGQ